MTESEFWDALEKVYGPALGHSLVQDLYIANIGGTSREALNAGVGPDEVWAALVSATGKGEEARWIHRRAKKK